MRWSCPHCGISLSVSEDTLGTGWSFSRCYKCGGFALIRRAEINIIKVDKAPPGERVILPEASKDPTTAMLSEDATQKLARHMALKPQKTEKASVQPPPPPHFAAQNTSPTSRHLQAHGNSTFPQALQAASSTPPYQTGATRFPDPLPDTPVETPSSKAIPVGIALTATMAVTSGIYLYMQSQALWHKARDMVKESNRENGISKATPSAPNLASSASSIAASSAGASPTFREKEPITPSPERSLTVQQAHPLTPFNNTESNQQPQLAPAKTTFTEMVTQELRQENQAHPPTSPASLPSHAFMVKVRLSRANLHSGPGAEFPVIGEATPNLHYLVSDWNNRWFRLTTTGHDSRTVGWVRNDLVQVIHDSVPARIATP